MSGDSAPAQEAAIAGGDPLPYLLAAHRAALLDLGQALASLENRLLGGPDRGPERERDLLMRQTSELAQQQ
jgi:hypothetical protein